jgi:inner membrane protein YidH
MTGLASVHLSAETAQYAILGRKIRKLMRLPMIRSYSDHAANERTFLAWARTGLSAVALGMIVEKGSLLALAINDASSPMLAEHGREYLGIYGGPVLVGTGIAVILGASLRFAWTALRIDDQETHTAGIVRLVSALLHRRRQDGARPRALRPQPVRLPASGG